MTRRTFLFSPALPALLPAASTTLAITNTTTLDATGPARSGRTVVVRGDRIVAVGNASVTQVPRDAQVVSGRGRFLMPGLWDMHVHLCVARESALPVLLANGVTGVRDMGGLLHELDAWGNGIEAGVLAGPRIVRAGPIVNGKAFNQLQVAAADRAEARGVVRALHKAGVDFIKVHAAIGRDAYTGVSEECRQLGLRFAGHLPRAVAPEEAIDAGQASLEHLETLFDGTLAAATAPEDLSGAIARFRQAGAEELFARFAKSETAFTPTLAIERPGIQLMHPQAAPTDRYISRPAREVTDEMRAKYKDLFTPEYVARQERQLEESLPLVALMHRAGVMLLAGTDMGSSLLAPGFSLHGELALLAEAGVPAADVLKAATYNPARVLGLADQGTIAEGKRADLVLVDANPLEDIRNTRKIRAVVARGRLYDRAALDALLSAGAARAASTTGQGSILR